MLHSKMALEVDQRLSTSPSGNQEIEDIIVLKNNKGTEDNRVRKLDYSIQISKQFSKGLSVMETSHYSHLTIHQVCTMLLALTSLMISIHVMNLMSLFQENYWCSRTYSRLA